MYATLHSTTKSTGPSSQASTLPYEYMTEAGNMMESIPVVSTIAVPRDNSAGRFVSAHAGSCSLCGQQTHANSTSRCMFRRHANLPFTSQTWF